MTENLRDIKKGILRLLAQKRNIFKTNTYISLLGKYNGIIGKYTNPKNKLIKFREELELYDEDNNTIKKVKDIKKTTNELTNNLNKKVYMLNLPSDLDLFNEKVKSVLPTIPDTLIEKNIGNIYFKNITSLTDIRNNIRNLYNSRKKVFKMSLSFGFILEIKTEDILVYTAYDDNKKYYNEATIIRNKNDLNNFLDNLTKKSIMEYLYRCLTQSSQTYICLTHMKIKLFEMENHIGSKINLPDYILNSHNVVSMKDSINNMCFWNCYAYHLIKNKRCNTLGKQLFVKHYGSKNNIYKGFDINSEVDDFEIKYNIGINIFEWDDNIVNMIRRTTLDECMNLLLYQNHFCYITNIDTFDGRQFGCEKCGKDFINSSHLKVHNCNENIEDKFCKYPTIYEPERNLIIKLNEMYNTNCDFRFKPLIVYDFESIVERIDKQLTTEVIIDKEKKEKNSIYLPTKQKAVSVSLYSNVEGFNSEPYFIENQDETLLFEEMFNYIHQICEKALSITKEQFKPLYEKINIDKNKQLYLNLERYVNQIPIVGFNSGKYDINLSIQNFMKQMLKRNNSIHSIKTGNCYKSISTDNYNFLDICQYIPPNYNLDAYIKAFNPNGLTKSVYPYEFMDSYDKLDYDINLIEYKDFYSTLKNSNISVDEYNEFKNNIVKYEWKTLRDLLKFYNNLDVKPFLEAVINQKQFFYDLGLDMFKDGLSLPALAEKIMFSYEFKDFNEKFINRSIQYKSHNLRIDVNQKLKGYKEQDKATNRYSSKDFIQNIEVINIINKQSAKCYYCWFNLKPETFTLDRINNDIGHNTGNCVACCLICNTQRKNENFSQFYRKKALIRYAKTKPLIHLIDEENKEVFYKLKNNIVGGASLVFHRFHEADKTKIKRPIYDIENDKWDMGKEGKVVKNITGFDANALYLWCIGNDMPCGKLKYTEGDNIDLNTFFGFVEVDIETPKELYNQFGEFPLIFKNVEYVPLEESGEYMNNLLDSKTKKVKKLISSFSGEKVLIKSNRLKWLVEKGLKITKIYGYIECERGQVFKNFTEKVSEERRKGDINKDYAIIAEMWKLVGNSAFGRTGMDKSKFKNTVYGDEHKYKKEVASYLFKDANLYGDTYEISKRKRVNKMNIPIQIASSIYDDAKYRMSEFYYDCVDKFISRDDFQYIEMDTDSAYMALTDNFFKLIKPELKETFEKEKSYWFPRTDTDENKKFDKRKAGLFKEEFIGSGIVALSSKCYFVKGFNTKDKFSCKGVQQKHNQELITFNNYKKVLMENVKLKAVGKGMRILNDKQVYKMNSDVNENRTIYNYQIEKVGLSCVYDKRIVLSDGISTVPLNI